MQLHMLCVCVDWNYDQHSFTISAWQHVQGINSAPTIFELPILRFWAIYTVTTPPTPNFWGAVPHFWDTSPQIVELFHKKWNCSTLCLSSWILPKILYSPPELAFKWQSNYSKRTQISDICPDSYYRVSVGPISCVMSTLQQTCCCFIA